MPLKNNWIKGVNGCLYRRTTWEYLKGARLGMPSADKLETKAIGLGIIADVKSRYESLFENQRKTKVMYL